MGILQAIAGGLIVAFTVGGATQFGMSMIAEGIGDIVFSARSIVSKNFNLKEYLIQKTISLTLTILTGGFANAK